MLASLHDTGMRVNNSFMAFGVVIKYFSARPDTLFKLELAGAGHAELVHFHLCLPAQALSSKALLSAFF